ncbi:MAG: hypothetical protein ACLFMQ_01710 [Desulfohalobiaceae bacterium]
MEYLTPIIISVLGAALTVIGAWVLKQIRSWLNLDPQGQIMDSLERWEDKIVDWILSKAEEKGEDLSVPDTRWKFVNQAVEWFLPRIPKLMDYLGYSKQDLANDVEALVKRALGKIS